MGYDFDWETNLSRKLCIFLQSTFFCGGEVEHVLKVGEGTIRTQLKNDIQISEDTSSILLVIGKKCAFPDCGTQVKTSL